MSDRIRICFISFMFSPVVGGSEVQAEKQARQLQAIGHRVPVVTLRLDKCWKPLDMLDGLPVIRVGGIYRRSGLLHIGRIGYLPANIALFLKLWQLHYANRVRQAQKASLEVAAVHRSWWKG